MKAIYACKLYKSSTRKEKIQAALSNPLNVELVEQIADYLDEEYQVPVNDDLDVSSQPSDDSTGDTSKSSKSSSSGNTSSSHISSAPVGGDFLSDDHVDDEELESDDTIDDVDNPDAETDDEGTIDSSTNLSGSTISASTDIDQLDLSEVVNELKGALNLRDDTSGVTRARVKDNEIWIHYNDNINLNNVMGQVIEYLEASGYFYLEFNRLARSENAVVFQISEADTNKHTEEV